MNENQTTEAAEKPSHEKATYEKPALVELGRVEDMTRGSGSGPADFGPGKKG